MPRVNLPKADMEASARGERAWTSGHHQINSEDMKTELEQYLAKHQERKYLPLLGGGMAWIEEQGRQDHPAGASPKRPLLTLYYPSSDADGYHVPCQDFQVYAGNVSALYAMLKSYFEEDKADEPS